MTHSAGPVLNVGILSAERIHVVLESRYLFEDRCISGVCEFVLTPEGRISFGDKIYDSVEIRPEEAGDTVFSVRDVTIGVNFHWERKETQRFRGALGIIVEGRRPEEGTLRLTLINRLPLENYLESVISSEMSATSSPQLLRAHAVVSRSWLLAQLANTGKPKCGEGKIDTDEERHTWYDREDHINFDVCADDHCQRYQGITRQTRPEVAEAVAETAGVVLVDDSGEICDARFSKCCGGVFELFESCWEPVPHPYLKALRDAPDEIHFPDLRIEENAREWILGSPEAFCNTTDEKVLGEVLNSYDRETAHFYRWTETFTRDELRGLLLRRTGIDFGDILELKALERGTSGRIVRLLIRGTLREKIIGKELEIRRSLSESHLYSSAFVAEATETGTDGIPSRWTLHGAGWGHGVGLCQIGAAMMAHEGYEYKQILAHYFPGANLKPEYGK